MNPVITMYINKKLLVGKSLFVFPALSLVLAGCSGNPATQQVASPQQQVLGSSQQSKPTLDGSTHTHNGVPHTHPLPATGLNHTHNYNNRPGVVNIPTSAPPARSSSVTATPVPRPVTQPPSVVRRPVSPPPVRQPPPTMVRPAPRPAAVATRPVSRPVPAGQVRHSHSGRVHTHALPAQGVNHTHNVNSHAPVVARPQPKPYSPPVQTARPSAPVATRTYNYGSVDTNVQYNDYTAQRQAPAVRPVVAPRPAPRPPAPRPVVSRPPAPQPVASRPSAPQPVVSRPAAAPKSSSYYDYGGTNVAAQRKGLVTHSHDGKTHSHLLPSSGVNHKHNIGSSLSSTYQQYATGGKGGSIPYTSKTTPNYRAPTSTSNQGGGDGSYLVQKGDTVFQVMRNSGVYWKDIIKLNNLQAPGYTIHPGQRLRLK